MKCPLGYHCELMGAYTDEKKTTKCENEEACKNAVWKKTRWEQAITIYGETEAKKRFRKVLAKIKKIIEMLDTVNTVNTITFMQSEKINDFEKETKSLKNLVQKTGGDSL